MDALDTVIEFINLPLANDLHEAAIQEVTRLRKALSMAQVLAEDVLDRQCTREWCEVLAERYMEVFPR